MQWSTALFVSILVLATNCQNAEDILNQRDQTQGSNHNVIASVEPVEGDTVPIKVNNAPDDVNANDIANGVLIPSNETTNSNDLNGMLASSIKYDGVLDTFEEVCVGNPQNITTGYHEISPTYGQTARLVTSSKNIMSSMGINAQSQLRGLCLDLNGKFNNVRIVVRKNLDMIWAKINGGPVFLEIFFDKGASVSTIKALIEKNARGKIMLHGNIDCSKVDTSNSNIRCEK